MTNPIRTDLSLSTASHARPAQGTRADDFCGTPVPGHPPIPHEKLELSSQARAALGGGAGLGLDDDWCGTKPPRPPFPTGSANGILIGL